MSTITLGSDDAMLTVYQVLEVHDPVVLVCLLRAELHETSTDDGSGYIFCSSHYSADDVNRDDV